MNEGDEVIIKYFKEKCVVHKVNKDDTVWLFSDVGKLYCVPITWLKIPSRLSESQMGV